MIYPLMQALDIAHLGVDVAVGGIDQRKIHMLARKGFLSLDTGLRYAYILPSSLVLTARRCHPAREITSLLRHPGRYEKEDERGVLR